MKINKLFYLFFFLAANQLAYSMENKQIFFTKQKVGDIIDGIFDGKLESKHLLDLKNDSDRANFLIYLLSFIFKNDQFFLENVKRASQSKPLIKTELQKAFEDSKMQNLFFWIIGKEPDPKGLLKEKAFGWFKEILSKQKNTKKKIKALEIIKTLENVVDKKIPQITNTTDYLSVIDLKSKIKPYLAVCCGLSIYVTFKTLLLNLGYNYNDLSLGYFLTITTFLICYFYNKLNKQYLPVVNDINELTEEEIDFINNKVISGLLAD